VLTHTFTGLTPDTAYTLEVRAYNTFGDSAWTSVAGTTAGPPDTPTGLTVTASPDGLELELDWAAATGGPTGYDVRIDGGAAADVGNVLTHTFTGLTPGTAYTLEVRAYNAAGDSAWASIGASTTVVGRAHPALGALVTVAPLDPRWQPEGLPYYAGLLTSFTLTISNKRPVASLVLLNSLGRTDTAESITWDEASPTVTLDQLDDTSTIAAYRLIGD
jgi:hypothetical protein